MDGRVQRPVNAYLRARFNVEYIDTVTAAGPVRMLSDEWESEPAELMLGYVGLSVDLHSSQALAVVSHHDCAGNPVSRDRQYRQLNQAVERLRTQFTSLEVIGLWVDDSWEVHEVFA